MENKRLMATTMTIELTLTEVKMVQKWVFECLTL